MFRIKMAIALLEEKGKEFDRKDLANALWPNSEDNSSLPQLSKLINGKMSTIRPEWVSILCEKLECSADFLFGIEKTKDDE